jgi:HK97 family phage major capsid protein
MTRQLIYAAAAASMCSLGMAAGPGLNMMMRGPMVAFDPREPRGGATPMDLGELSKQFDTSVQELKSALTGDRDKLAKLDEMLSANDARLNEVEQKLARRGGGGGEGPVRETWGAAVTKAVQERRIKGEGRIGKLEFAVKSLTSATDSAGALASPQRSTEVVMLPQRQLTIRSLLNARTTTAGLIEFQRQTLRTNNAAAVATEGAMKPESFFEFEAAEAKVVTIAHWTKASKQILADAPQLGGLIDGELTYGLKDAEETQLLYGDGSPGYLEGMITVATAYSAPFAVTGGTMIDQLRLASLQARLARYPITGYVLNPADWAHIEMTKDNEGRYIIGNPRDGSAPTLWGKPVVESDAISVDKFLVGAFGLAAKIWDREEAHVLVSDEDGENFRRNEVTILAEERLALEISRPEALVYGDFGNV